MSGERSTAGAWAFCGIGLCAIGVWLGLRLPVGIYPEVTYPRVVVVASLLGQPVETLDVTVTRPIEEAIASVPGVRRVRGHTIRGATEISILFDPRADVELGFQRINAELAALRGDLPAGTDVVAQRITAASTPVVSFALLGSADPRRLREIALYELRPRLAGLRGIGIVDVVGGEERELEVEVSPDRLAAARLSMADLASRLREALPLEAAGRIDQGPREATLLVRGSLDPAALPSLPVGGPASAPVRLGDVATVRGGHADRFTFVASGGGPAVLVHVGRQPGADAVELSRGIHRILDETAASLPKDVRAVVTYDQADLIAPAVGGARDAIAIGALLAVLVMAAFLRSLPATLLGALSLPLTLGLTLLAMALFGQSWNLMTLGGLAVAIGLVVDDAVVVIEAIERHRDEGLGASEAAARAIAEVRLPVITSTAATIVVLAPLALLSGVVGQFFRALAFTLGAAVALSLVSALLAVPLLARRLGTAKGRHPGGGLTRRYRALLGRSLSRPWAAIAFALCLLLAGGFAATRLASSFLPDMDEGAYIIDFLAPAGTSLAETEALAQRIDGILRASPFVRAFSREVGAQLGPPTATQSFQGDTQVRLVAGARPEFDALAESQREALEKAAPQLHVEFSQVMEDTLSDLEGQPQPIEVKIFGADPARLRELGHQVADRIRDVPGLADLFDGDYGCSPSYDVDVDSVAAGRIGLSAGSVAGQIREAEAGEVVGRVPFEDRLIDVRLRLTDGARYDPHALDRLRLKTAAGPDVPLRAVAQVTPRCATASLLSENLRRMVAVTARLSAGNLGAVAAEVKRRLADLPLPEGSWWELGGQALSQQKSFGELLGALGLAVFGLCALLAFHFGSLRLAIAVLGSVPVALACGALSLFVAGVPINVSSLLGGLVLAGLIVKNGVLLVDQAEASRRAGQDRREALLDAAVKRLRPIAMTTLATLLGLLPLALGVGAGADIQRPLAVTVLGGLAVSSLVTLFALPSVYLLL